MNVPSTPVPARAGVNEGEMGVAEKAQGQLQVVEGFGRVELAENVVVLVERRAVADGELLVDDLRPLLQVGAGTRRSS